MRQFAKMKATFYTGGTGRALRGLKSKAMAKDAMLLAHYLVVGPSANQFGLYQLETELATVHLPLTAAEVLAAMAELERQDFCRYDAATRWVWVIEMAGHQLDAPLKTQDNVVRSIKRWYETSPKNPWLGPFFDRYEFDLCLSVENERSGSAVPRRDDKPLRRGSEGASEPPVSVQSLSHSGEVVGGAGGEGEEFSLSGELPRPALPKPWRQEFFDRFMALYPKQVERRRTAEVFAKVAKSPEVAAEILEGLERLRPHFDYRESGRFIMAPFRWLENERWKDEPPAMPHMSTRTETTARAVARAAQRGAPR